MSNSLSFLNKPTPAKTYGPQPKPTTPAPKPAFLDKSDPWAVGGGTPTVSAKTPAKKTASKRADIPSTGYNYTESSTASGKPAYVRKQEIDQAEMNAQATRQRKARPAPAAPPKPAIPTVQARPMQSNLPLGVIDPGAWVPTQAVADLAKAGWQMLQPKPQQPEVPTAPEPPKGVLGAGVEWLDAAQSWVNPVWRAKQLIERDMGYLNNIWGNVPEETKAGIVGGAIQGAAQAGKAIIDSPPLWGLAAGPKALNAAYNYFSPDPPVNKPAIYPMEREAYLGAPTTGEQIAAWGKGAPAPLRQAQGQTNAPAAPQPPPGTYLPQQQAYLDAQAADMARMMEQARAMGVTPASERQSLPAQAFNQWWGQWPARDYFEDTAKGAEEILAPYMDDDLAAVLGKSWAGFVTGVKGVTTTKIGDLEGMAPVNAQAAALAYMGQVANQLGAGDITVGQAIGAYGAPLTAAISQEFGQGTDEAYRVQNLPANATPLQAGQAIWSQVPKQVVQQFVNWDTFNRNYTNTSGDNLMHVLAESGFDAAQRARAELTYKTTGAAQDKATAHSLYQESESLLDLANNPAVPAAEREAARDQSAAKAQEAVNLWNKAVEGEALSYGDIFNKYADIRAELFTGVLLDPWNLFDFPADAITDAVRAAQLAKTMVNAGAAPGLIKQATKAGTALAEQMAKATLPTQQTMRQLNIPIEGAAGRNWLERFFGRTGDTQAHMGASAATSYFAQVFKGVDNAADAAKLIDVVLTDPQKLLTGV
ncbi:MAG: hypothetical protein KAX65_12205, partial [Caldilineaceae bacterium]|nr:hypothetical protein [Caldilineaceae bacterium]